MNRGLIASLIILVVCIPVFSQDNSRPSSNPIPRSSPIPNPEGWVIFNSEPGRFSVLMPEMPTDKTEIVQSEHGPYTSHFFKVHGAKSVFVVAWVDYDSSFNFNTDLELEVTRDSFIKGINATLINNRNVMIDGYQSIEFTAETGETVYKSRVYMVGRRPYQLVVGTAKGLDDSSNANRFFDSFKVRLR